MAAGKTLTFSITNTTKRAIPRAPFLKIKEVALGKAYNVSLVLCGNTRSRRLNRTYRGKDYATNVLAFPVSETSGEIFINLARLKGFTPEFLFIHGLLHLKGMEHSATMERAEQALLKKFHGTPLRMRH